MITLQSKAWTDVFLTNSLAAEVMSLFNKKPGDPAIILVEQLPEVIARFNQAISEAKKAEKKEDLEEIDDPNDQQEDAKGGNLAQRLVPILHLLEASQKAQVVVTWDMVY